MIHDVGHIGHEGVQIVLGGTGLDVEVARHPGQHSTFASVDAHKIGKSPIHYTPVDQEKPGHHASWVIISAQLLALLVSLLLHGVHASHVVISGDLGLEVANEGIHGAVRAVVRGLSLPIFKQAEHGESLHLVLHAKVAIFHAVHLNDTDRHLVPLYLFGEGLPHRLKALAPNAPRSIKVDKCIVMLFQPSCADDGCEE
jgi:hypothetical protein